MGESLSWRDIQDFINHLAPTQESALYRELHPKSWWWTPEVDFLSAILHSVQMGNWQRGGGAGSKPKPVKRPDDSPKRKRRGFEPQSASDLAARRKRLREQRGG